MVNFIIGLGRVIDLAIGRVVLTEIDITMDFSRLS